MLRALRRSSVVGVIALAVLFGSALPASAKGRIVHSGQSIQAAINAASPGDTIIVGPGVYHENLLIKKDGLTIIGEGATLKPPARPGPGGCNEFGGPPTAINGICIDGEVNLDTLEVKNPVSNTRIIGFRVTGFPASGIVQFGGENATFIANTLTDNGEYGAAAFVSAGTSMIANRASGSGEAGLYLGDSPNARARVVANDLSNNGFGLFVRDAEHVSAVGNFVHGNCLGLLVLGDAPGPAGVADVRGNLVRNNTKVCPGSADNPGTVSGVGIALSGAHDVNVHNNIVTGNKPGPGGAATLFSGGVVIATGDGGTKATGNTVRTNVITNNTPDILWDRAGSNTFSHNLCRTSIPNGLC
jgi:hypothetical protein